MLQDQLVEMGFSKNEASVYLALFELQRTRAGRIIEQTDLHRNIVYTALEVLEERELLTKTIVGGVAEYVANDPLALVEEVERKKNQAVLVSKQLQEKLTHREREVKIFEGYDGMKRVNDRSLRLDPGETAYVFGVPNFGVENTLNNYWNTYHKKRIEKEIKIKLLYDRSVDQQVLDKRNALDITEARYMPQAFDMPMWMYMSGDEFAITTAEENPLVVHIKSQKIVDAFTQYFEFIWNQKIIVETGLEALEHSIYEILDELNPGEEYFVLGASVGLTGDLGKKLYDKYHIDRIQKGIVVNMLAYEDSYDLIKERFAYSGDPEGKISHLKKTISSTSIPMQINMCRGVTRLFLYGEEPLVIRIDNPEIHDGFKSYFDALWNQETITLYGADVVKQIWLESVRESATLDFIGARGYFVDHYPEMFAEIIEEAKKVKDLRWRNVVDESARNHKLNTLPWMEAQYSMKGSKNPNVVWLWGKKVAIANWTDAEPVVLISENPHLVQSYRDYFDELWGEES